MWGVAEMVRGRFGPLLEAYEWENKGTVLQVIKTKKSDISYELQGPR